MIIMGIMANPKKTCRDGLILALGNNNSNSNAIQTSIKIFAVFFIH
jgi:hypothetical protein